MTKIDESEMGRIALKLVKIRMMREQLPAPANFRRELGAAAKEIGESAETLQAFYETLLPALIGKMLGYQSVGLTMENPIVVRKDAADAPH